MEALSVKEYRNNLAASFTKADRGERVLIRRRKEIYALVKVGREDLMITPELQKRIDEVHLAYRFSTILLNIHEQESERQVTCQYSFQYLLTGTAVFVNWYCSTS